MEQRCRVCSGRYTADQAQCPACGAPPKVGLLIDESETPEPISTGVLSGIVLAIFAVVMLIGWAWLSPVLGIIACIVLARADKRTAVDRRAAKAGIILAILSLIGTLVVFGWAAWQPTLPPIPWL